MKFTPSTAPRQFTPELAALVQAALRLGLRVEEKQEVLSEGEGDE